MEVYRTDVTVEVGYSIQTPSGDWQKNKVALTSQVGPGYPSKEFLAFVLKSQVEDATAACNEQIQEIANKIVQQVQLGNNGNVGV